MKPYHVALAQVAKKVNVFLNKTFDTIEINKPEGIERKLEDAVTMIACTHRSQADYFVLGNYAHRLGISNLRFAAGDNLTTLPILGPKFLSWGAFTVERDRARDRKYIFELCDLVAELMEDGDNIIVFPEMGRSYSGAMLEIKQVILGAAVIVQARHPEKKVGYLPCSITYEKLPELRYFDMLHKGKAMRKPGAGFVQNLLGNVYYYGADIMAFSKFWQGHRFGKKYGNMYVDFGEPMFVNEMLDLAAMANHEAKHEFWVHRKAIKTVSESLYDSFMRLYRIMPAHVISHLLKEYGATGKEVLIEDAAEVIDKLEKQNRNIALVRNLSGTQLLDDGIRQLDSMRSVNADNGKITITNQSVIDYYAATVA
ncbi:MAG: hypothetical protein GF398_14425 [Chitinivibrionales bacterium]|nr:hypothetical protein [Chitinivibrionales bacterium]